MKVADLPVMVIEELGASEYWRIDIAIEDLNHAVNIN
jgi:hypothetical protein